MGGSFGACARVCVGIQGMQVFAGRGEGGAAADAVASVVGPSSDSIVDEVTKDTASMDVSRKGLMGAPLIMARQPDLRDQPCVVD